VRLQQTDHDVTACFRGRMPLEQHPIRLADAGSHAQKHAQVPAL
jgi:hypothetical protein